MELEVLRDHCSGIPETGVISIRAGGTRRQAQLATLDRPFKFPNTPEECSTFKVDVLNLLGSGRLAYDPSEDQYALSLEPPEGDEEGAAAGSMEVAFRVRRNDGERGVMEGGEDTGEQDADKRREQEARQYLEKHGLTSFMQFLMQSLMKDKPSNPYSFLQKQVTKRMVTEVSRSVAGDRIGDLLLEDKDLDSLVQKFSSPEALAEVTPEQLAQLERDAALAGDQLREDNARLRETKARLKEKYMQISGEMSELHKQLPAEEAADLPEMPPPQLGESPQMATYREIAHMQGEITSLAKENAALVTQLAGMRTQMDQVHNEIQDIQTAPAVSA